MRIFHTLLIALVAMAVVPVLLFSGLALSTAGAAFTTVIDENAAALNDTIARTVNSYLGEVERMLDIARAMENDRHMGEAERAALLIAQTSDSPLLQGAYLLGDTGSVMAGLRPDGRPGQINLDRALFDEAMRRMDVVVGPFITADAAEPAVDVIYPINGTRASALYLRFRLEYMLKKIRPYVKPSATAHDFEQDRDAMIINPRGGGLWAQGAGRTLPDEKTRAAYAKDEPGVAHVRAERLQVVSVTRGPGWLIVLDQPAAKAYAPVRSLRSGSVALIGFSFIAALGVALLIARRLSRPIETIISGIEVVAQGNLDHKIARVPTRELGTLVRIFNDMTARLKQLQEDMKKSERLSAIGQMANILGHEIRNPLAAISGSAFLLKRQAGKIANGEIMLKPLAIIEKEVVSTNKIIDDMLGFSRTRALVLTTVNFPDIVRTIMEESKFPEKLVWAINAPEGLPTVSIDLEEVKQVIRNLVNNAVDAMDKLAEPRLNLIFSSAELVSEGAKVPAVRLEIADNGCGMSPEVMKRIFEPFYSTKSKGTGLGLAVVFRIIEERHHGKLDLKSIINTGTSFFVTLPSQQPAGQSPTA